MAGKKSEPRFAKGQRIWKYDNNRRIYADRKTGKQSYGPIFREYFIPAIVVEVRVTMYLIADKDGGYAHQLSIAKVDKEYKSDYERIAMIWDHARNEIAEAVHALPLDDLLRVAKLIEYSPDLEP